MAEQYTYEIVQLDPNLPIRCNLYQVQSQLSPSHWHEHLEIIYLLEGQLQIYCDEEEYTLELPDPEPGPQEALLRREQAEQILAAMERLKPEQKEAIILRDIQGFSYEEISGMVNCSIGTVKSRINRARSRLRDILLEQNPDFFRLTNRS